LNAPAEEVVPKTRPSNDTRSFSDFQANVAEVVRQVRRKRRPVVLTQNGRGAAVLMGVSQYEALVEELELLRDAHTAERQLASGRSFAHSKARTKVLSRIRRA
jgi:prevent-host-death family protein